MTLEVLFARENQGQTFLLMAALGVGLGAFLQLAGSLHRWKRAAGMTADVLWAVCACILSLLAALHTGSGLRLYALLGLVIGLVLYCSGLWPLWSAAAKKFPVKAGKRPVRAESSQNSKEETAAEG